MRSTRLEVVDQALVAVVNDVVYDFAQRESLQVATLWMSVERHRVISVRMQPLRAIDHLRIAVKAGESLVSPLALVDHLLRDQADVLIAILRSTASKVDAIEDQLMAGRLGRRRLQLGALRRNLLRLQRLLAPEPAAMFRLLSRPPRSLGPQNWDELRQSTEEFSLVLRDLAAQQERIKLLQEEVAAGIEERTGRTLFVLTAVTVVALPMNVIAGLFGMNVGGIPFADDRAGFWTMLGLVVAASALVAWLLFRGRDD
ncbi:MAG: CorA family divalent cation transporter [Pseudomonadota bacterium]